MQSCCAWFMSRMEWFEIMSTWDGIAVEMVNLFYTRPLVGCNDSYYVSAVKNVIKCVCHFFLCFTTSNIFLVFFLFFTAVLYFFQTVFTDVSSVTFKRGLKAIKKERYNTIQAWHFSTCERWISSALGRNVLWNIYSLLV